MTLTMVHQYLASWVMGENQRICFRRMIDLFDLYTAIDCRTSSLCVKHLHQHKA